jgi:PilZ domain
VAWQYGAARGVSRVATMGLGGLFITTPEPAPVGTLLRLIFDLPGGEVRARAMVRDIHDGEGMAVAFIAMDHAARARLDQMMKRLLD